MDERILEIILKAKDEASETIEGVGKKAGGTAEILGKSFKNAAIVSGVALAGLTAAAVTSVEAFEESDKVMQQTNAVLKSTHEAAGMTADQVSYLAGTLMRLTGMSDETIQSGENMLLTFTSIGKDVFPQATKTMLDMSVALGQDVKSSAIQLGKALQDPILGVTALRRVGVNFNQTQMETIKHLVNTGHALDAQKMILKELNTEFGGSAAAQGKTFTGMLNTLKESVNNLQEALGGLIVKSIQPLIPKFQDVVDAITDIIGGDGDLAYLTRTLTKDFGVFGTIIGKLIQFFGENKQALMLLAGALGGVLLISLLAAGAAMLSFISLSLPMIALFAAIGAGVALVVSHWSQLSPILMPIGGMIVKLAQQFIGFIINISQQIELFVKKHMVAFQAFWNGLVILFSFSLGFIKGVWNTIWKALADYLLAIWQIIKGVIEIAWGGILVILSLGYAMLTGDWNKAWEGIKKGLTIVWDGIKNVIKGGVDFIISSIKIALNIVIGLVNGVIDGFNNISSKVPSFKGIRLPDLPHFQDGGFVPSTGLAVVHAGEFVLSNAMLQGRQSIPNAIQQKTNYHQPITINATVGNNMDINELGYKIAFLLRNSR